VVTAVFSVGLPTLLQVVAGLLHAHAQGVWHLDVKPDNVLLANSGSDPAGGGSSVRVADFGAASLSQWTCQRGGTKESAPPEMFWEQAGCRAGR
jgi:serine/threonine protein kinase